MLRRLAVALFGCAFLTTPSYAGDLFDRDRVSMKDYVAPFTWSGFYLGADLGWAWASVDHNLDWNENGGPLPPEDLILFNQNGHDLDANGFIGGGYLGYNFQSGNWVFGVEGDIQGVALDEDDNNDDNDFFGTKAEIDINWLASVRGRLGYAFNRSLIYVTGGVAWTDVDFKARFDTDLCGGVDCDGRGSDSETLTGWVIGGGWEYAFSDAWIGRIEYRHYEFDEANGHFENDFLNFDHDIDLDVDVVKVGLSYKFPPRYEAAQPLK